MKNVHSALSFAVAMILIGGCDFFGRTIPVDPPPPDTTKTELTLKQCSPAQPDMTRQYWPNRLLDFCVQVVNSPFAVDNVQFMLNSEGIYYTQSEAGIARAQIRVPLQSSVIMAVVSNYAGTDTLEFPINTVHRDDRFLVHGLKTGVNQGIYEINLRGEVVKTFVEVIQPDGISDGHYILEGEAITYIKSSGGVQNWIMVEYLNGRAPLNFLEIFGDEFVKTYYLEVSTSGQSFFAGKKTGQNSRELYVAGFPNPEAPRKLMTSCNDLWIVGCWGTIAPIGINEHLWIRGGRLIRADQPYYSYILKMNMGDLSYEVYDSLKFTVGAGEFHYSDLNESQILLDGNPKEDGVLGLYLYDIQAKTLSLAFADPKISFISGASFDSTGEYVVYVRQNNEVVIANLDGEIMTSFFVEGGFDEVWWPSWNKWHPR